MKIAVTTFFVLVLVVGVFSCGCVREFNFDFDMEGYKTEFERTYALDAGGRVEVKNVDGFIHVDSWDKDEVLVNGTLRVKTKNEEEARKRMKEIKVVVTQDENLLSIQVKREKRMRPASWFQSGSWRVDLELTVPEKCNLSLSSVDGAVRVVGVDGSHELTTVDGSLRIENVKGNVKGHSVDGSCTVVEIEGDVNVSTTDGRVDVTGVLGDVTSKSVDGSCTVGDVTGSVSASTVDGRIGIEGVLTGLSATAVNGGVRVTALEGSSIADQWKISTVDGSVTLVLPESLSADLRASTLDGHVSLSMPAELKMKTKRSVVATLGGGGGVIDVSTTDGSIRVRLLEAK
ncbi:MAG: hypothetical protein AMJ46_07130 [Latescibacteria bacterium DG_63]|nr:MAG: hypothetical protein AMJ46_07130 [Latescibacteria bacterium DG_63]